MIKQKIRQVYQLGRRYYKKQKYRLYLREKLKKRKIILVHQMGKVASSSIVNSLRTNKLDIAICQTHYLKKQSLDNCVKKYKISKIPLPNYIIASQEISKFVDTASQDYPWKIITIIRDPIHRNISAFFQNAYAGKQSDLYIPNLVDNYEDGQLEITNLIDDFLVNYPHEIPLKWLDRQVKDVFGIDVYQRNFPHQKGYQIIKLQNVNILILKLECLQNCLQTAVSEFLEIDNFQLNNKNQAKQKGYFDVYSDFLNSITLPQS
ncbi:putative capsular polysaccharide synthesis family protein [Crocosphaera sp.]|uniref:putative capsular polysaccharide synthesis family protein n=1 Tax=Crocosphaera sp. TaxID=2729996 RepID=UPI002621A806|nr:putative capsular polysaccharide synthesis family protein [Crocosphaera sp.]MDJ0582637.1 putative capsular polysaccharide synthesis family protein [Crocosphaera sp.]